MLSSSYNNVVSETRAYNNDYTLASISFSGAPIGNMSYTWDENKTSKSITGVISGYGFSIPTSGYDAEDRLVGYQRNDNSLNQSWNLSLVGDWNSVTTNAATQSRTHGPTHEILTAGSDSIMHDAKGSITAKPSSLDPALTSTLQWDFDNRLKSMDVNEDATADATFRYDALGRRVQKNSTVYALTGQQVIAEYSAGTAASSPTEQYVFASYIDETVLKDGTGGLAYYYHNQQYIILALTNSSGVLERYSYDVYGKLALKDGSGAATASSTVGNSITYTGQNFDSETGDYCYRARYYNTGLGRFCGRDPIGHVDGESLYSTRMKVSYADHTGNRTVNCTPTSFVKGPASITAIGAGWGLALSGSTSPAPVSGTFVPQVSCVKNTSIAYAYNCPCPCGDVIQSVQDFEISNLDHVEVNGGVAIISSRIGLGPATGVVSVEILAIVPTTGD